MRPKSDIPCILHVMQVLPSIRLFPSIQELESIIINTSPYCVSESVSESASESDAESASATSANFFGVIAVVVALVVAVVLEAPRAWLARVEKRRVICEEPCARAVVVRDEDPSCAVGS